MEGQERPSFTFALGPKMGLFIAVALGLLVLVIGVGVGNMALAGTFIMSIALFWGVFLPGESVPVKVTLLAVGGLLAIA
jgi:hypothetical protein